MDITVSDDGFINMMKSINGGAVLDELDRAVIDSVSAILDNGGQAAITVKFTFSRIKNLEKAIDIGHDVAVKLPKEDRVHAAMFITNGNGLASQHQQQESLPLGGAIERPTKKLEPIESNIPRIGKGE